MSSRTIAGDGDGKAFAQNRARPYSNVNVTICVFIFVSTVLLVIAPAALRVLFPAIATFIGFYFYLRYPASYIAFTWWIYFLTPFLRRVIDYRVGFDKSSIIMATPLLVTLVCGIELVRSKKNFSQPVLLPFALALLVIVYGLAVGIVQSPEPFSTVEPFLSWIAPVMFGYFICSQWRAYPVFLKTLQSTFLWGVFMVGLYGLVQFVVAPAWDTAWMVNIEATAFGSPEPFGIRTFSTMNAPQVLGAVLVFGVLFLSTESGIRVSVAQFFGYAALILTSARSAWLEWIVGIAGFLFLTRSKRITAILLTTALLLGGLVSLAFLIPSAEPIRNRFESLASLNEDASGQAREQGYSDIVRNSITSPFGSGLGAPDPQVAQISSEFAVVDSSVTLLLQTMGWFGLLTYYAAILISIVLIFRHPSFKDGPVLPLIVAIAVSALAESSLNTVTEGAPGVALWTCLGLGFAHVLYSDNSTVSKV